MNFYIIAFSFLITYIPFAFWLGWKMTYWASFPVLCYIFTTAIVTELILLLYKHYKQRG